MRHFIAITLVLATAALAQQQPAAGPKEPPTPQAKAADGAVAATLDKRIPVIKLDAAPLGDVIDFLGDMTGANIFVDWKSMAPAVEKTSPVTVRLKDVEFSKVLEIVLKAVSSDAKNPVTYIVSDGVISIGTRESLRPVAAVREEGAAGHEQTQADRDVNAKLEKRLPQIRLEAAPLGDVIDFLGDMTGANIFVDWKSMEPAVGKTSPVTVRLKDVKSSKVLEIVLKAVSSDAKNPVTYIVSDGVISIGTRESLRPTAADGQH